MELELALARKGRQAAEDNSKELRENLWKTVVAAVTVVSGAAAVVFGVLNVSQNRPKTIANNAAMIANNAAIELANNAAIEQV